MQVVRAQAIAARTPPLPSAQVVNKVILQDSSNGTFLKNTGIADCSYSSRSSSDAALPFSTCC
ncbi:hypothetical protein HU200_011946 [Digitaria exilis]|uniref:Uncharacterized protein n=1 Tax=Digitaria exilis TaxID=1010633 RepID=A0A835KNN0_9POAL|nr:hypothetical protein HU200_011946 [Digitaria exilis]